MAKVIECNDTEKVLNKLGIALRTSETEWRDMWDVMNEIGTKWDDYNEMQKNAIVVAQAGVRQSENLRATYANWNKVLKYTAEAYDSAGYSAKRYQVYLDSVEGKMNTMKATYQDLVSTQGFKDMIKGVIDLTTAFGELVKKVGILEIALGLIALKLVPLTGLPVFIMNTLVPALGVGATAAKILGFAMTTIAPLAIVAGIIGLVKVIDHFSTSLKEQTEKVDNLKASLSSLNSEYDTLKNKGILTESENKRILLLEKEIKLTELLMAKEKEREARMIINEFTGKQTSFTGYSSQRNYMSKEGEEDTSKFGKVNKDLKKYNDNLGKIKESEDKISKGVTTKKYEELKKSIEELNTENSELIEGIGLVYQEILPATESTEGLSQEVLDTIYAMEKALGLTEDYSIKLEEMSAVKQALANATNKVNNSEKLTKEEVDALIKKFPNLADSITEVTGGFLIEKDALDAVSSSVSLLDVAYKSVNESMNDILSTSVAKRINLLQTELEAVTTIAQAYALFENKGIMESSYKEGPRKTAANSKFIAGVGLTSLNKGGDALKEYQQKEIDFVNQVLGQVGKFDEIKNLSDKLSNLGKSIGGLDTTGVGGSDDSKDPWKEAFEREYKDLNYYLDKKWITEEDYYKRLIVLNDKYFKDKAKYIDDYRQYELEAQDGLTAFYEQQYEDRLAASLAYIEERNFYNDWGADSEIAAYERVKAYTDQYYADAKISAKLHAEKIKDINRSIHTARIKDLEKQKSEYDSAVSAVNKVIDDKIDKLNEEKEALEAVNKATEDAIKLEQLQEAYENAKKERKIRIYSESQGWHWEEDKTAVEDARKELSDFKLEQQLDAIDKQIKGWEKYKKVWTDAVNSFEVEQNRLMAAQKLGAGWEKDILNQRLLTAEKFKTDYNNIMAQLQAMQWDFLPVNKIKKDDNTLDEDKYVNVTKQQMKENSILWHTADAKLKKDLESANQKLGQSIGGKYNSRTGTWTYHDGIENGLVGDIPFDKNTEIIAKLAKGEAVLNPEQMSNMIRNMTNVISATPNYKSTSNSTYGGQTISIANVNLPSVKNGNDFMRDMRNIIAVTGNQ